MEKQLLSPLKLWVFVIEAFLLYQLCCASLLIGLIRVWRHMLVQLRQ